MTVKDQLKILDRKIKQNRADYDLYRTAAEVSALTSGELDKYEYLTGKDLEYKPDPIQKAKFEYSPLGQVFNKGLDSSEKSEGLLKRLKNIEDKGENQSRAIEDQGNRQLALIGGKDEEKVKFTEVYDKQNEEAKVLYEKISKAVKKIAKIKKKCDEEPGFAYYRSDKTKDDFSIYIDFNEFAGEIQKNKLSNKRTDYHA